jgi:SAM-dependent methyltransferase
LADRGLRVFGVDIAASRIGFARRWAVDEGGEASFAVGDAAALPFRDGFHAVLILGGSFAHSTEWETNAALLRHLGTALLPSGILLIDNPNPVRFWRVRHGARTPCGDDILPFFDLPLSTGDAPGVIRYYGAKAMERLLGEAGFRVRGILGDREGGLYAPESPRLIAIGEVSAAGPTRPGPQR